MLVGGLEPDLSPDACVGFKYALPGGITCRLAQTAPQPNQFDQIVFASRTQQQATNDLWIYNTGNAQLTQLTTTPDIDEILPAGSPDGKSIAYLAGTGGIYTLWIMDNNGNNPRQIAATAALSLSTERAPQWFDSGAGQKIAFAASGGLYVLDFTANTLQTLITTGNPSYPTWSANGQLLAYAKDGPNSRQIFIYDYLGGAQQTTEMQLTGLGQTSFFSDQPDWSPDSSQIAFRSSRSGVEDVFIAGVEAGGFGIPLNLTILSPTTVETHPAWFADSIYIGWQTGVPPALNWESIYSTTITGNLQVGSLQSPTFQLQPSPDGLFAAFIATDPSTQVVCFGQFRPVTSNLACLSSNGRSNVLDRDPSCYQNRRNGLSLNCNSTAYC